MKLFLLLFLPIPLFAMEHGIQQWDGTHYQKHSSPQVKTALDLLETLELWRYPRILDVGSGSGQVMGTISKKLSCCQIKGIDANADMVKVATANYHSHNLSFDHVDAQDSNARFFTEYKNYFDLAFSSAVFLWIQKQQAAFDNIHTVLKPGGHMMVKTTAPRPKDHPLNRALGMLAQNPKWAAFAQAYMSKPQSFPLSIDQAHQIITPEKWTNIKITERGINNPYNTKEEFCEWMQGWMGAMPAVAALEKETQIELCQDFVTIYTQLPNTHNSEGKIIYSLPGILIEADKK